MVSSLIRYFFTSIQEVNNRGCKQSFVASIVDLRGENSNWFTMLFESADRRAPTTLSHSLTSYPCSYCIRQCDPYFLKKELIICAPWCWYFTVECYFYSYYDINAYEILTTNKINIGVFNFIYILVYAFIYNQYNNYSLMYLVSQRENYI